MQLDTRNHSSGASVLYAAIAVDTDLGAAYPLAVAGAATTWKLPRQVIVHGNGNLAYAEEHDAATTVTVPVTAPFPYDIAPRTLKAATTATNILVLW